MTALTQLDHLTPCNVLVSGLYMRPAMNNSCSLLTTFNELSNTEPDPINICYTNVDQLRRHQK